MPQNEFAQNLKGETFFITPQTQEALAELLYWGMLQIRSTEDLSYARNIADFLHNVPQLIQDRIMNKFKYFLFVEYKIFLERCEIKGWDCLPFLSIVNKNEALFQRELSQIDVEYKNID